VRIYGYGNRVEFNCFKDNPAKADDDKEKTRSPIGLWWGKEDYDPNWLSLFDCFAYFLSYDLAVITAILSNKQHIMGYYSSY
jgi:hypothetical protein